MLTIQEYTQLLGFLNRTSLQGSEAPALVNLVGKLRQMAETQQKGELATANTTKQTED